MTLDGSGIAVRLITDSSKDRCRRRGPGLWQSRRGLRTFSASVVGNLLDLGGGKDLGSEPCRDSEVILELLPEMARRPGFGGEICPEDPVTGSRVSGGDSTSDSSEDPDTGNRVFGGCSGSSDSVGTGLTRFTCR